MNIRIKNKSFKYNNNNNNNDNNSIFSSLIAQKPMLIIIKTKRTNQKTRTHKQKLGNMYHVNNNDLIGTTFTAMMQ
jgi:hypothetical protein